MSASVGVFGLRNPAHSQLFRQWNKLLHLMVRKNMSRLGDWFDYDDLMNVARQALWRADDAYDPEAGANFQTFARRVITNAFNAMHKYSLAQQRRDRVKSFSVDDDTNGTVYQLADQFFPTDLKMIMDEEVVIARAALEALKGRDKKIITDRVVRERTLEQVGADLNLTRERVRQIEGVVLARMASSLRSSFPGRVRSGKKKVKLPSGRRPKE